MKSKGKRKFFEIKKGVTRLVFLIGNYAIKFPYWRWRKERAYRNFLNGLIGNMNEVEFGRCGFAEVAPVILHVWGGFMVVMPRATPLSNDEWLVFDYEKHFKSVHHDISECKQDSFGKLNDKIVAVDYGG